MGKGHSGTGWPEATSAPPPPTRIRPSPQTPAYPNLSKGLLWHCPAPQYHIPLPLLWPPFLPHHLDHPAAPQSPGLSERRVLRNRPVPRSGLSAARPPFAPSAQLARLPLRGLPGVLDPTRRAVIQRSTHPNGSPKGGGGAGPRGACGGPGTCGAMGPGGCCGGPSGCRGTGTPFS